MAEGARYSSMYDVYTGFNFRNFTDYNNDGTSTWAELAYCRGQNPNYSVWGISLDLWRVNNWAPDDNYGGNVASYNWQRQYWGDVSAGTYHFTLSDYNASWLWYNPLSCDYVNYGW